MRLIRFFTVMPMFLSFSANARTASARKKTDISDYNAKYKKLRALYIKRKHTLSYKEFERLIGEFTYKLNTRMTAEITVNPLRWIKVNIADTDFKNIAEAEKEYAAVAAAQKHDAEENHDFFDFYREVRKTYGTIIYNEMVMDVLAEYPELKSPSQPKRSFYKVKICV